MLKIITEDLRFYKKDDVWLVMVNIILQIEEVAGQAFDVPS